MPHVAVLLASAVLLCVSAPADAQYFGRNKVQYESFDFQVLETEHFDIYFYPRERAAATTAARLAERWYVRLSSVLDHTLSGRQPLILYATQAQFQQTNAIPGQIGEGTGGVTEGLRRRIVLPVGGTLADLDHVIGHELVHAFQYDMTGLARGPSFGGVPGAAALPLWFIEGMAEYFSIGAEAPHTAMWMRGALADSTDDSLPTFDRLDDPRFFPYRYGHAFLAFLAGHWGDQSIARLLRRAAASQDMAQGLRAVFESDPKELVARWHTETHAAYDPLRSRTRTADSIAKPLITARDNSSRYNIAPALSPDGSRLVFLSDRGLFSIDLFLADARTGEIQDQVTETAFDPHLQSLHFLQSAGGWSPDGERLAVGVVSGGRPVLTIYDIDGGGVERKIKFDDFGELLTPQWSPDGRTIAFSGVTGGLTDLYLYDLEREELTQLTDDRFADLQPVWSPDGRTIAFATDRFTTDPRTLDIGAYQLALMDVGTREIRRVGGDGTAKQINPQWAPGGQALYFLSDPGGITNVYRVELASGQVSQVTDLFTGVSGITATSPALSVAQQSGRLVFSVFRANGHDLYAIDDPAALAGRPVDAPARSDATQLPPARREGSELARLLANTTAGLPPADTAFRIRPYDGGLALAHVGPPTLVAGTSQFGTFVGGGTSLYFTDMLGNRNLATALQVYGDLQDLSAMVAYQNLSDRLNWGLIGQQAALRTGGYAEGFAEIDGETVFVQQQLIERQINRDAYAIFAYPFNESQRLDFAVGYSNISFDREIQTRGFSTLTGQLVLDEHEELPAGSALNQGVARMALVFDNSFFGAASPIRGQRYRFEAEGNLGSISYAGALADYRRYFLPLRPFTVAFRLMHYGRYGSGGEDPRLQPLFIGYPGMVRGYTYGSFDASECDAPASEPNSCPVFDQLLGSRIGIANAELRFPLLGLFGIGSGYYGALPLEFLAFADAGLAWDSDNSPKIFGSDGIREPVTSAGVGLRMNLFGFAIIQLNYVRPFDRPAKDWIWQFDFQPGF